MSIVKHTSVSRIDNRGKKIRSGCCLYKCDITCNVTVGDNVLNIKEGCKNRLTRTRLNKVYLSDVTLISI